MAMIISYPTRTRGMIVLLKTLPQYRKLSKKIKITRSLTIFAGHGLITRVP